MSWSGDGAASISVTPSGPGSGEPAWAGTRPHAVAASPPASKVRLLGAGRGGVVMRREVQTGLFRKDAEREVGTGR